MTWEDWPYLAIISRSSEKLRTADGTIVLKNWIYTTEELPPSAITLSLSGIIEQRKWNHQQTGRSQYESTSIFVLRSCLLTNVVLAITGFCYLQPQNIMTQPMISPKQGKFGQIHLNSPLWLVPSISIFIFNKTKNVTDISPQLWLLCQCVYIPAHISWSTCFACKSVSAQALSSLSNFSSKINR